MPQYDFESQVVVASFALGDASTLQVALVPTSDGGTAIGLREWVSGVSGGYSGPTKNGLLLSTAHLADLIDALEKTQEGVSQPGYGHGTPT